ncbi:PAS domain S-box protein [Aliirhizobium terrae]|uniref:PAS domain S-box protein n=1 Tax=Terrirhizobium terrae TaxID=2926709 RepID=UPI003369DF8E
MMHSSDDMDDMSAESRLALFDFAFANAPIGIALVHTNARIIKGNSAFARMVGRSLREVAGIAFADFTHPDDVEADLQLFRSVLAGERDGYSIEKRYVRPGGEIVFVRIHVAAMRDEMGDVARFITQIEDIGELKASQLDLEERSAKLELALDALPGGFWHLDVSSGASRPRIIWRNIFRVRAPNHSTLKPTSPESSDPISPPLICHAWREGDRQRCGAVSALDCLRRALDPL